MDAMLYALNAGKDAAEAAEVLGFTTRQVERAFRDIQQKRSTTRYLHLRPILVEALPEIESEARIDHSVGGRT